MHVGIINRHPSSSLGGSEMQCDLIARELVRQGHEVTYFTVGAAPHTSTLPYACVEYAPATSDLGRLLAYHGCEHAYWRAGRQHLLRAAMSARLRSVPLTFAISGPSNVDPWWIRPRPPQTELGRRLLLNLDMIRDKTRTRLDWEGFRLVSGLTSNTQYLLDRFPSGRGLPRHRATIYNIANPGITGLEPFTWPRAFVAWVANVSQIKNPEALREVCRRLPTIDVLMVGEIREARYDAFNRAESRPRNLHYLGAMTPARVNGLLASASCLLHTSFPEGFSGNLIQAWSQGCPTVSLFHDPDGLATSHGAGTCSGSLDQLVEDIKSYVLNATVRSQASVQARRLALECFDGPRNVGRLVSFLRSL